MVDVFSLGVVLYEALAGKKPFEADSVAALIQKVVMMEPPDLVLPDGRKYPELQTILGRALAKEVQDRYATANEMWAASNTFVKNFRSR